MLISFKRSPRSFSSPAGFTLIELIVVSAIILIITAFVLFQQAKFNSSTLLRSLTYSVALSIRQAQVYGTSVRGFSAGGVTTFGSGYGIYFPGAGTTATTYSLFADSANGDGARAGTGGEDVVPPSPYQLGNGYAINRLCTQIGSNTPDCTAASLTVFFRRPNPEACIATPAAPAVCALGAAPVYSAAYIELTSTANSDTRSVKVTNTGQITICSPNLTDLTQC